ncbi:MAG TPA: fibronectin type III domain-containing protein [Abditibacterium sp.]|jgi:hypothetical protein
MADEFPQSPEGWVERADEFLDVAESPENAGIFDSDAAELLQVRTLSNAMLARVNRRHALQNELDGLSAEIKQTEPELERGVRGLLKTAAASKAPDAKKAEAGVTIPKPRVDSAPITPADLSATPDVNGTALVKWNRSGNIRSCKFLVYKRVGTAKSLVDVVSAVELKVPATIGEMAFFSVVARNGQGPSQPSEEVVIYPN